MTNQKVLKISVILITSIVTLLIIELFLMLFYKPSYKIDGIQHNKHLMFDEATGYSLKPNINDKIRSICTDSFGFRKTSKAYNALKKSIIFVGDSVVFGWGVKDEETFVYKLSLDHQFDSFNIINMGVPAYGPGAIMATIKNKVPKYNPKIVVISVLWPSGDINKFKSDGLSYDFGAIDFDFYRKILSKNSKYLDEEPWRPKIYMLLRENYYRIKYKEETKRNLTRAEVDYFMLNRKQEEAYALSRARFLMQNTEFLRSQNVITIFYIHPAMYTIFDPNYLGLGMNSYGILIDKLHAIDMKPFIRSAYKGKSLYLDAWHLTPEGNDVVKDIMFDVLAKNIKLR